MIIPAYLQKRQKRASSRYHRFQDEISAKYSLVKNQVSSKFHGWKKHQSRQVEKSTLDFVVKYDLLSLKREAHEIKKIEELMKPVDTLNSLSYKTPSREPHNWKRGRITGHAVSIVVRDGKIVQKVYLTAKGNKISVKRNQLGLLVLLQSFFKYFSN